MKTYDEMAQSALRRIDEHNKIKAKREKMIIKTVTPVICVCFVTVLGIGLFKNGIFEKSVPVEVTNYTEVTQGVTEGTTGEISVTQKDNSADSFEEEAEIVKSAPTSLSNSDEAYKKFINREGSAKGQPGLCFTVDTETISGNEARKNPDIAKYLPESEKIQIKYIHYRPKNYNPNSPVMFIEGYVYRKNNESTRFMIDLTPLGSYRISGFNLNTFSDDNFSWATVLGDSTSVFGDGYSFRCYNDTLQYLIYVEDTEKETLLTLVNSLK